VIMLRFSDEVSWRGMQVYINGRVPREGEADLWASCGIVVNAQMASRRVGCKVMIENQADIQKGNRVMLFTVEGYLLCQTCSFSLLSSAGSHHSVTTCMANSMATEVMH
jgi:hypothetical protein